MAIITTNLTKIGQNVEDIQTAIGDVDTIETPIAEMVSETKTILAEKAVIVIEDVEFTSLEEFVIGTDTKVNVGNANGKFVIFTDTTGWGPTGTAGTEYKGYVIYQNYYGDDISDSVDGNVTLYNDATSYTGIISGNKSDGVNVIWNEVAKKIDLDAQINTLSDNISQISSLNYSRYVVKTVDNGYGDLNDYLDIGIYVLSKNTGVANTANCPTTYAGVLFVTDTTGSNKSFEYTYAYRVQTYVTHKGESWSRYVIQDSTVGEVVFSRWTTPLNQLSISTDTDFNTLQTSGTYHINVSNCSNAPMTTWGTLIVHFESVGTPYQIFIPDGDRKTIYKRGYVRSSSTWSSWYLIGDNLSQYLKNKFTLMKNTNLDTMTIPGTYQVINDDSSIDLNFPSGINGLLIVMQVSDTYIRQFYFRYGTVDKTDMYWYTRQINISQNIAGTWKRILSEDDITPSAVTNASLSRDAGYIQDNMTIQYVKCGHIVTVTVAGSMSTTATATYNGLILGYNLPVPIMRTCGVVRVDGDSDSCLVVNSSGCIFIEVRNKSVAGKSITGSVTYICK